MEVRHAEEPALNYLAQAHLPSLASPSSFSKSLSRDLHWIYSVLDPNATQRLRPNEFGLVTKEGNMGLGTFDLPRWHKREGEHILRKVGIKPKILRE